MAERMQTEQTLGFVSQESRWAGGGLLTRCLIQLVFLSHKAKWMDWPGDAEQMSNNEFERYNNT